MPSMGATTVSTSSRSVISMPSPPKEPARLDLHLPVHVGVQERGVRIEAPQRAFDRVVDDVLGRDLVHVLALDDREHLGEEPQVLVGGRGVVALARHPAAQRQGEDEEQRRDHDHLLHVPDGPHRCVASVRELALRPQPLGRVLGLAFVPHLEVEPRPLQRAGVADGADRSVPA